MSYPGKKTEKEILAFPPVEFSKSSDGENILAFADNLQILATLLQTHSGKIDLVYIDPPFATNSDFKIGKDRANSISRSASDETAYSDKLVGEEFLEFLRERLVLLRELLSTNGSIYLHIDYKIGHYVKVLMDEIFGRAMFRNDIARIKCNPKNFDRKAYGNVKDLVLFYSNTDKPIWNDPRAPLTESDKERLFKKIDGTGRRYTTTPLHAPGETPHGNTSKEWRGVKPPAGRHWRTSPDCLEILDQKGLIEWSSNGIPRKKIFLDESKGKKIQDIWEYKDPINPDYPTEKNREMLDMIVNASSNEGSYVLDCFAGSGTTILAAQDLNRKWIGVDQSSHAIGLIRERLGSTPYSFWSNQV